MAGDAACDPASGVKSGGLCLSRCWFVEPGVPWGRAESGGRTGVCRARRVKRPGVPSGRAGGHARPEGNKEGSRGPGAARLGERRLAPAPRGAAAAKPCAAHPAGPAPDGLAPAMPRGAPACPPAGPAAASPWAWAMRVLA